MSTFNSPPPPGTSTSTSATAISSLISAPTTPAVAPQDPDELLYQVQQQLKESDTQSQSLPMDRHSQGGSSASRGGSDKQPDSEILDAFLPRIEARGQRSWQPPKKGDGGAARGQSSHAGPSGQGGHGKS